MSDMPTVLPPGPVNRAGFDPLRSAMEHSPIGMALVAFDGRFIEVNPALSRAIGYERDEIIQLDFQAITHPDDLDADLALAEDLLAGKVDFYELEKRYIHKNGHEIWVQLTVSLAYSPDGKANHFIKQVQDISQRKEIQRELEESNERFRAFAESTTACLWAYTPDRWIYCNDALAELTGYSKEELMQPDFFATRVVHPDHLREAGRRLRARLRGEPLSRWIEYRIITRSGEVRWIRATGGTFVHNGESAAVSTAFDITDRKLVEDNLRESAENFQALASTGDAAIFVTRNQQVLYANAATHELLGRNETELSEGFQLRSVVHPAERAAVDELADVVIPREGTGRVEVRVVMKDGTVRWIDLRASTIAYGGAPAVLGIALDINARKQAEEARAQAEEHLRRVVSAAPITIWATDAVGNLELLEGTLGGESGTDRGLFVRLMSDTPMGSDVERALTGVTFSGTAQLDGRTYETHYSPMFGEGENVQGVIGVSVDVTERVRASKALVETQKLESLGRLVGGIAHDFNNVLSAILGYAELVGLAMEDTHPARDDVEEMVRAARSAAALTRQLLAFARRQEMNPEVLDLTVALERIQKLLRRIIGEDIAFQWIPAPTPIVARMDPGQLEQVIINLAVNARDAMPEGGRLTIRTLMLSVPEESAAGHNIEPGEYASIEVTDTGMGMTPEVLSQIWEPFFTTKERGKGTGLGLPTCHGIVRQAGGQILVYSEPGHGTTMRILLPFLASDDQQSGQIEPEPPLVQGRNETILLVEDDDELRRLSQRILAAAGFNVLEANGPLAALDIAQGHHEIDLIITDIVMPVMDGVMMVDLLSTMLGPRPVIFASGYAEASVLDRALERSGDRFLPKPFAIDALVRTAREALDHAQLTLN